MAFDRMAEGNIGTYKILAVELTGRDGSLKPLVKLAKHRWIIERDYEELKQELGLGHYEGRGWRGFHHHATLCIAAYGFLVSERSRFSPSARVGHVGLRAGKPPQGFRPRGSPGASRAA
jgi:SRSO17 transposase